MLSSLRRGVVTSPSGVRWRVRRKWLVGSAPGPLRPLSLSARSRRIVGSLGWGTDWQFPVLLGVIAVVTIVLIPVLLLGVELLFAGVLVTVVAVGRVVFRRPWVVEAISANPRHDSVQWRAASFWESREMIREVRSRIAAGWEPSGGSPAQP